MPISGIMRWTGYRRADRGRVSRALQAARCPQTRPSRGPTAARVCPATGGAGERVCKAYDGFGGAEMKTMFVLHSGVRPAEQVAYCIRERRNTRVPDNLVNFTVTKTVPREQRLDHR